MRDATNGATTGTWGGAWRWRGAGLGLIAALLACTGKSSVAPQDASGGTSQGASDGTRADGQARPDEEGIDPWGEPGGAKTTDADVHTVPIGGPAAPESHAFAAPPMTPTKCIVTEQHDGRASVALAFEAAGGATTLAVTFVLDALPTPGKSARSGTRNGDLGVNLGIRDKQSSVDGSWVADGDASGAIKPDCVLTVREAQTRDAASGGREQRLAAQLGCQSLPGRDPTAIRQSYLSFAMDLRCRGALVRAP